MKIQVKPNSFLEIPTELEENNFIKSLYKQSRESLSEKQHIALLNILGKTPVLNHIKYNTKTFYKITEYFNYCDYHGDYMISSAIIYKTEIPSGYFERKLQDRNASDHGCEQYFTQFELIYEFQASENFSEFFMLNGFRNFLDLEEKIKRNKFRKESSRYKHIKLFNDIVSKDANDFVDELDELINFRRF